MLSRYPRLLMFAPVLVLAACSTAPRRDLPLKAPAPPAQKAATAPSESVPALRVGEYAVLIESEPTGGVVVVDGKPVGRTPQRIVLNGTKRGFCREDISIKVRFVAEDSEHTSQTVEETLTPLDKIPARVVFTPIKATRVAR